MEPDKEIAALLKEILDVLRTGREQNEAYMKRSEEQFKQQCSKRFGYLNWLVLGTSCVAIGVYLAELFVHVQFAR